MPSKSVAIRYTSREYATIKSDLIEFAKRYYPDTFQDFNEASFGALMLDSVAYIGDMLSFYLDYQVNESFLDSALEFNNVLKIGRQLGYKWDGHPSSYGDVTLYAMIPANSTGLGPDTRYIPVLKKNTTFGGAGSWLLMEDVDFANSSNEVVVGKINESTGIPTHYAIRAYGRIVSGQYYSKTINIGSFTRFRKVRVGPSGISEVLSVKDSAGNDYYEVEHLSQDVVYKAITNTNADKELVTSVLKPVLVPRRFTLERGGNSMFLQFGYGSESEITKGSIPDPRDVVLDMHAKEYITDRELDPSKLTSSDKFGISPSDTDLTIVYRANMPGQTTAAAGSIKKVSVPRTKFTDEHLLSDSQMSTVRGSIEVSNEEPITGISPNLDTVELKRKILGHFAAQNRAVTKQDYLALVYTMPSRYGSVKRANILRDPDSFKRNLNLYVIGQDTAGKLASLTDTAKENMKVWLNQKRMISDTIDILDAKVINYAIEFEVSPKFESDSATVLSRCLQAIKDAYVGPNKALDIAEPVYISKVYSILNKVEGVQDTKKVKIVPRTGGVYSEMTFNFKSQTSPDGRYISVPENCIMELKYGNLDVQGTVK